MFSGSDLPALTDLILHSGALTSLPGGAFSGMTGLRTIQLQSNDLTSLPATVFSGLTALESLELSDNDLGTSLPDGVFSGLTALTLLNLSQNDLTSLPDGVFSGPTALTTLLLDRNDLTSLPDGLFTGLTALGSLTLDQNDLTSLPDGAFSGLTALAQLNLGDNPNTGDTLPLTVTVEKVGTDQARGKVLAGAPFAVDFTPTVVNGSLPASDTKLAVAAGSVEGAAVTVTRTSGTTESVTVDIDLSTQPTLPTNHAGYTFARAASGLPTTILSAASNNDPVFASTTETRTVPENSAAGTNVGAVIPAATDADTGDTLSYSMGGADAAAFAFDASTRQITTKTGVTYNHEATKNSYSVTVTAADGNGGTATVAVTINVTDAAEQPAKPAKPTVTPTAGAAGSLDVSWVKPDLNGGPEITGYDLEYREGTGGTWNRIPYAGTAVTTTISPLTADTEYEFQVRAKNGETESDWSDASDVVKPNAVPTIASVAITSTPLLISSGAATPDTYGAGEEILFTVTFSGAVDVTGDPYLAFSLDSGEDRAPYKSGGGTTALVFGYTVLAADEDDDGIFLFDGSDFNNRDGPVTLDSDDEIVAVADNNVDADLAHTGRGTQSDHKVDGSRASDNNAPSFTSSPAFDAEENATAAGTVAADDSDADDAITGYAVTGGADRSFFSIVAETGVLTFDAAPNFEDPQDQGTDNTYAVTVAATSGTGTREMTATQAITVTVADADEKSAKPAKPTLSAVSGSSATLTATWEKPDLNGGPDVTDYNVQFRQGAGGAWMEFSHTGAEVTTTLTGLTADTEYQARVQAVNGETDSDWSDASDAVGTNAEGTPDAPTIVDNGVAVTSTPRLEDDTYGEGETIEISVTFNEVVSATANTDFVLNVSGARRAPLLRGSNTATLVFGYTVGSSDDDDNGIWIGDQDRTLVGDREGTPQNGAITSAATGTAADLTHAELGALPGHKVDGSREPADSDNAPPVFTDGESTTRTVTRSSLPDPGSSGPGVDVGPPVEATDDDDDDLEYTLQGDDRNFFIIFRNTGQIQTVPRAAQVSSDYSRDSYSVRVKADDGKRNGTATIGLTINITDSGDPPPKQPPTVSVTASAS